MILFLISCYFEDKIPDCSDIINELYNIQENKKNIEEFKYNWTQVIENDEFIQKNLDIKCKVENSVENAYISYILFANGKNEIRFGY